MKIKMHTNAKRVAVAQRAGVAESTVSRALADSPLISAETKQAVRAAAEALGYIPNRQAAIFATQKTRRIGIVIPVSSATSPFSSAYFPALLDGAVLAAEKRGYSLTIVLDRVDGKPRDLSRVVSAKEADGLLFSILRQQDPRLLELRKKEIPFVLTNAQEENCICVSNNPKTGMRKAFEHLRSLGHSSLGYISGDLRYQNATERLEAFKDLSEEFETESICRNGDFSRTSGYFHAGKMLCGKRKPTLIMTASDRCALGVLQYCRDHRVEVPDAVSVIGYDNLGPSEFTFPPLTTIDNPIQLVGATAADLLIEQIEHPSAKPALNNLDTGFTVRESTGPCIISEISIKTQTLKGVL